MSPTCHFGLKKKTLEWHEELVCHGLHLASLGVSSLWHQRDRFLPGASKFHLCHCRGDKLIESSFHTHMIVRQNMSSTCFWTRLYEWHHKPSSFKMIIAAYEAFCRRPLILWWLSELTCVYSIHPFTTWVHFSSQACWPTIHFLIRGWMDGFIIIGFAWSWQHLSAFPCKLSCNL